nr:hypothetical protein [Gemmatimonadota bacterium]
MTRKIYLIGDQQLQPMTETPYDTESLLQRFLAQYPDLLGGDQMNPDDPRRLILVKREMQVADREDGSRRWALDHLYLDQEGIPTLVEVKRASNTQLRREVVAQMLDYAANGVMYWPLERIRSSFEETCRLAGCTPATALSEFLRLEPSEDDEAEEAGIEAFWGHVKTNLEAERLRLVFVADEIPPSLQRIIEFLNGQMSSTEVLAVEVKQFVGGDLRTLVARVIGQTARAQTAKGRGSTGRAQRWEEASFLKVVTDTQGPDAVRVVNAILAWARSHGLPIRWLASPVSAFIVGLQQGERQYDLFRVKAKEAVVLFYRHAELVPFDAMEKRNELAARFNSIPGASVDGSKGKQ